jgi:hypothetical protein
VSKVADVADMAASAGSNFLHLPTPGEEWSQMSCEHLICARCAGPVVEGRCPTCRAARAEVHHPGTFGVSPILIGALLIALTLLIALKLGLH